MRLDAPLRGHVECPDRLHLIAEEFNAYWVQRIGREDVQDATPQRELTGQLDCRGALRTLLGQPMGELLHVERFARLYHACGLAEIFHRRHGLQEALNGGDDNRRPVADS